MRKFLHSGDLGDTAYALPSIKALGGGDLYLTTRPFTKAFTPERINAVRGLFEYQDYITAVHEGEPAGEFIDFSTFRNGGLPFGENIATIHAKWVGLADLDLRKPWLTAPTSPANGRVVVHRSPRYENRYFPWREIGEFYGDRLLAIGFQDEWAALCETMGRKIEFAPVKDLLEAASLMSAADLFIGNQSSPMAVAIGLGIPLIQETCLWVPDCVYPRVNAQYVYDGGVILPALGQGEDLVIDPYQTPIHLPEYETPPCGWQACIMERRFRGTVIGPLVGQIRRELAEDGVHMTDAEIKSAIMETTAEHVHFLRCKGERERLFGRIDEVAAQTWLTATDQGVNNLTL